MQKNLKQKSNESVSQKSGPISEWCNEHKAVMRIFIAGMTVLFILLLFFALRAWGTYTMEHYAYFATTQGYTLTGRNATGPFEGTAATASIVNNPEIYGCEQMATITATNYVWFETTPGNGDWVEKKNITFYYRFENKESANKFLMELGETNGRYSYALDKYVFDIPIIDEEGYTHRSNSLTFGELIYRAFVVFDFNTGLGELRGD